MITSFWHALAALILGIIIGLAAMGALNNYLAIRDLYDRVTLLETQVYP